MTCQACEDILLDLVAGELDDATARDVRIHASDCAMCSVSLAKLEGGARVARLMEAVDPPAIADRVFAAAHAKTAPAAPAPARAAEETGAWQLVLRFVRSFAMGPQAAMASVLVLMVGIGLWYVPRLREPSQYEAGPLVSPDPEGEVGPSSAIEPAEPLALDLDPRTGRIRTREEGSDAPARVTARPVMPQLGAGAASAAPEPAPGIALTGDLDAVPQEEAEARATESSAELELLAEAQQPIVHDLDQRTIDAPIPTLPPTPAARAGAQIAAPAPQSTPARDEVEAVRRPDTQELVFGSLLTQARGLREQGRCDQAVGRYEDILSRYAGRPETHQALLEAADCYRRLGRLGRARTLVQQATQVPNLAAAARRELTRLDEASRAQSAPAEPASAE